MKKKVFTVTLGLALITGGLFLSNENYLDTNKSVRAKNMAALAVPDTPCPNEGCRCIDASKREGIVVYPDNHE